MSRCPRCSADSEPTGKEWEYGVFHVKQFACAVCKRKFMEYYRQGKLSHTIPKTKIKIARGFTA